MEIYQLKTFVKVAEVGNITRAAEKLFTSQPAVSSHIKSLETEFGVRLFDRTSKGMMLTLPGKALLDDAERIINNSDEIFRKASSLRNDVSGTLKVGLNNCADVLQSGTILTNLTKRYPDIGFDIIRGDSGDVMEGVESGSLDVGFFEGTCDKASLHIELVGTIELCIAVPASNFDWLEAAGWEELAAQTWVYGSPKCSYLTLLNQQAESHGVEIERKILLNDDSLFLDFVANDLAVSIAPKKRVLAMSEDCGVKVWPHFSYAMPLSLTCLKNRECEPAIEAFFEESKRVWNT